MDILFEDNHVLVVVKPHGVPVQKDESHDSALLDELKAMIKYRDNKPGNVFLGLVHRLDRPVGGVMIFAKTSKAASRLSDQFRQNTIQKTYLAVVSPRPGAKEPKVGESGIVHHWLLKDGEKNVVQAFPEDVSGSQEAETAYTVRAQLPAGYLIEVKPKTGRSHQIRVALSSLGWPILGDVKYGAPSGIESGKAIALFAHSLSFDHPVSKERKTIIAKPALFAFQE